MAGDATVLMKVPGIEGNSTLVGSAPEPGETHEGWIPIDSCSFSVQHQAEATDSEEIRDDDASHERIRARLEPITVKRTADSTTAQLIEWLANVGDGRKKEEPVLIDYVSRTGRYYLRYELEGADLVSCKLSEDDEGNVTEEFKLTFDRVVIYQRTVGDAGFVDITGQTQVEYDTRELLR